MMTFVDSTTVVSVLREVGDLKQVVYLTPGQLQGSSSPTEGLTMVVQSDSVVTLLFDQIPHVLVLFNEVNNHCVKYTEWLQLVLHTLICLISVRETM